MIKFTRFIFSSLILVSSAAVCGESKGIYPSINDKDIPEPIKCYAFLGDITGDKEMPVGLAVRLCAGTRNAKATLACYKMSFEALGLNRGLAIELCSEGRKLQ
ncbi:MAG: hypothetical protein IOMNBAOH_02528 [Rhodocyclaceae bacterium]|nr:hypothetical protein [Rhodocyclaceae bacterium]